MTHIEIAATQGMKAGFKAYTRTLSRGALPQVVETRKALERMGKQAAFAWYCATMGPDVAALQPEPEQGNVTTRPSTRLRIAGTRKAAESPLAKEIAEARARLAELEAQAAKPKATRSSGKAKSAVKENLWRSWAVTKHGIPQTVGATFTYKGKRRTSTFKVTRITDEGTYTVRVS